MKCKIHMAADDSLNNSIYRHMELNHPDMLAATDPVYHHFNLTCLWVRLPGLKSIQVLGQIIVKGFWVTTGSTVNSGIKTQNLTGSLDTLVLGVTLEL